MIKFLIIAILCVACSKAIDVPAPVPVRLTADLYQEIIDKYHLDTTFIQGSRIIWWQDTISKASDKLLLDTTRDIWSYHCPDVKKPAWIEHNYMLKNGVKIQPSKYPVH